MSRPKAYFINGGAGRVLCSVPAFEKLLETDKDFIIVCEGGMDLYKGHPDLHSRCYDNWHKGLFEEHLKHRDIITPEPYRLWEYYNQKCSLSQAFDIIINDQGIRDLPAPRLILSKNEVVQSYNIVQEVKFKTGFDKIVVVQPFGRGIQAMGEMLIDPSERSLHLDDTIAILNDLKKQYGVILMNEFPIALEENDNGKYPVAMPQIPDLRIWAGIIDVADHFVGVDSVGQHIARALDKTATVIVGSTYPINISYPGHAKFDIFDIGKDKRVYDPIRISLEDEIQRKNDEVLTISKQELNDIIQSIKNRLGKSVPFKGKYVPVSENQNCCAPDISQPTIPSENKPSFSAAGGTLKYIDN